MGKPTTLATAVTNALNSQVFSPTITFSRVLVPIMNNEGQSREGRVFVLTNTFTKMNRCADYEETVDIGVYIIAPITNSAGLPSDSGVATMMDLVDSVINYMKTAGKLDDYQLVEIENPLFDFQRIYEESIFHTTITLRYKGF